MSSDSVVIVAARRTPIGAFQGTLSGATAPQLGATAIAGALEAGGVDGADVDRVLMGCVLPAGMGQAPARQAALAAAGEQVAQPGDDERRQRRAGTAGRPQGHQRISTATASSP